MDIRTAPGGDELEVTLFGPGYGEALALHFGGSWVLVDSCIDSEGSPRSLRYLEGIGIDVEKDVAMVVATHWHDDHIRGIGKLLATCKAAKFCCAGALGSSEFLAIARSFESRNLSRVGSGVREIHKVWSQLTESQTPPIFAGPNRRILLRNGYEIWSLSPGDAAQVVFLKAIGDLATSGTSAKKRVPDLSPNQAAVALWMQVREVGVLLGADVEKAGWEAILTSTERPVGAASVFKVAHHGSKTADHPEVWQRMLTPRPVAVLTPWQLGKGALPKESDVHRILSRTNHAYSTARSASRSGARRPRDNMVRCSIRDAGITLNQVTTSTDAVRLRRKLVSGAEWKVQLSGSACHLEEFEAI